MAPGDLLESLLAGTAPKEIRMMVARGLPSLPPKEMLELLVCLLKDADPEVVSQAERTIHDWGEEKILAQLKDRECPPAVLEHFAGPENPGVFFEAIIENPASPEDLIRSLALRVPDPIPESGMPPGDLSLEDLPEEAESRHAAITARLSSLSFREKVRHALFGNREVRMMLIRDTNREVARAVLRSPKLTDNEVESIAAMRGAAEEVLREIGNSKGWLKSYGVVQNLVKNPKTPPIISQRLLHRLQSRDLMLLTRDRSIPDAVRYNATRTLNQRASTRSSE